MAKLSKAAVLLLATMMMMGSTNIMAYDGISILKDEEYGENWFQELPPRRHHQGMQKKGSEWTVLNFYFHDIISGPDPTAVVVAHAPGANRSAVVFGALTVFDDPVTLGPNITSERIGSAQGIYVAAQKVGIGLYFSCNFVFTSGQYNGSTLSVQGRNAILDESRRLSVVGGTGRFHRAQGTVYASTYWANATSGDGIVKCEVWVKPGSYRVSDDHEHDA